jgi:acyl-CoA oxidase
MWLYYSAHFLLTELAHGLDAPNLETTATLQLDGSFMLNTPHPGAAKYMPPTGPFGGIPKVAIVFARLVVHGEDRGVRPFIVTLGNGKGMAKGVSAKFVSFPIFNIMIPQMSVRLLPPRAGSRPIDHAVTYFDHVLLPSTALLGKLDRPHDMRQNFLQAIWRVGVGYLALSTVSIPVLKISTYIAGKYSLRRTVTGPDGKPMPIISFRTQQLPILHAIAETRVLEAYAKEAITFFTQPDLPFLVRLGIGTAFKAVVVQSSQSCLYALAERCGAQGLYQYNQIIEYQVNNTQLTCIEL